jgi:hypothetical protein
MTNPNTKNGITKDSTLVINVPPYLPNNYTQILNHVGFWKWNPTLSQFDEGSQNDYNLLVQPLWFDAESGLPQKIRIDSSDTKRLKLENNNQDRSSEVVEYVEPSQNNLMVRFNTKTRSVTEYPYFEVESIPPTITNPVTSNGYYKFDGNTLISGTNQDYNINVNVTNPVSNSVTKIQLLDFNRTIIADNNTSSNWTFYQNQANVNVTTGSDLLIIRKSTTNFYYFRTFENYYTNIIHVDSNTWVYNVSNWNNKNINFLNNNDVVLIQFSDPKDNDTYDSRFYINDNLINFDGISWMTFN